MSGWQETNLNHWNFISRIRDDTEVDSTLLAICQGKPPVADGFSSQKAIDTGLWCVFVVSKVLNKQSVGESGCSNAHFDVTVLQNVRYK